MSDSKLDIGKLSEEHGSYDKDDNNEMEDQSFESQVNSESQVPVPTRVTPGQVVSHDPDIVWVEATRGLQKNLVNSLKEYKSNWRQRRLLANQRERMINEVADQYVIYLREEAKIASDTALKARSAMLSQELTKLRSQLYIELASLTGATVNEIEKIAQGYTAEMTSPAIQRAYAKFIMEKILDLLEQSP